MTLQLARVEGVKKLTPRRVHNTHVAVAAFSALVALSLVVVSRPAHAQGTFHPPSGFPDSLDRYIQQAVRDWEVPGLAIVVVRNDTVLAARGYGVRELGKPAPVDANTVFNIASLTKSFTTAAAAMLVDEGKLDWDAPAHRYLAQLEFNDPYLTAHISMRDLLSHRTGLHPANMMWQMTDIARPEIVRRARFLQADKPFRSELVYSNVGFTVAGEALAAAAHTSYEDLIRQRILAPLGMRSTTITMGELSKVANKVSPHAIIGGVQRPIPWRDIDVIAPAGAINSTANDMAIWLRFQLGNGTFGSKQLVSAANMWEMHSPQVVIPVTAAMKRGRQVRGWAGYALGWQVMDYQGRPMVWHSGNGDGQPSIMTLFPDDHLGIVVMMNTWAAGVLHGMLTNRIADTYLGLPPRDWSGEMLPRKAQIRAQDAQALIALEANRHGSAPASHDLAAYSGVYVDSLYGEQTVRAVSGKLTLQMAKGQIADLTHWSYDTFLAMWRDPLFREEYPSLVTFSADSDGAIDRLVIHLNRDHIVSERVSGK